MVDAKLDRPAQPEFTSQRMEPLCPQARLAGINVEQILNKSQGYNMQTAF